MLKFSCVVGLRFRPNNCELPTTEAGFVLPHCAKLLREPGEVLMVVVIVVQTEESHGMVGVCQLVCQPIARAWFHVDINLQLKISNETMVNMGIKTLQ